MILDALQKFSSAQSLAQVTGTYDSDNILDYGVISGIPSAANGGGPRDMGIGDSPALKLLAQIGTTFTSGGAATLQIVIKGAVDDGTGAPSSFSTWWTSPAYALATLVAGARLIDMDFPRPPAGIAVPRYVKLSYIIGGATTTAGTIDAYVVLDRDDQMYNSTDNSAPGGYRAGINVAN